jgi:quercetin dioxygenase-like cupin family protein
MSDPVIKNLAQPDETRHFPKGKIEIVTVGDRVAGRGTMEPGWRWSEHVKPIAGTPSCMVRHTGVVLAGRMKVKMDGGAEVELRAGDVMDIPPGHDAWIVGDERFVGLDFSDAAATFAKKP